MVSHLRAQLGVVPRSSTSAAARSRSRRRPRPRTPTATASSIPTTQCRKEPETVNGFQDDDGCPDVADHDGDGILDADDACVDEPEDVDGIDDDDGCPEADNDGDGLLDAARHLPRPTPRTSTSSRTRTAAPIPTTTPTAVPDVSRRLPATQPETFNGFDDDDGCPDELPKVVK